MGEFISAVFILMAGESLPGSAPDPRQSPDYDRCMAQASAEHEITSIDWLEMDLFCAAVVALDPSVSV